MPSDLVADAKVTFVAVIATLLCCLLGAQVRPQAAGNSVHVFGRIIGPMGPLTDERVILKPTGPKTNGQAEESVVTTSDKNGAFNFVVRQDLRYELTVAAPGFDNWGTAVQVERRDVGLGNVAVPLLRPIQISARVIDFTGKLLRGQRVLLLVNGREETHTAQTDSDGVFRFSGLQPSRPYILRISALGLEPTAIHDF